MFFWLVFLKNALKKLLTVKNAIFSINNGFLCVFKNTDQNNICAFITLLLKLKQKKNMKTNFFTVFISKLRGATNFFLIFFQL